jgi:hypothetical protein
MKLKLVGHAIGGASDCGKENEWGKQMDRSIHNMGEAMVSADPAMHVVSACCTRTSSDARKSAEFKETGVL